MKERLRALRLDSNLTQQELAKKLNSTNKSIWNYENGIAIPPSDVLIAYADFFNVSTDYLLGRTDDLGNIIIQSENSFPTSLMEQRLILDFRKLPAETQDNFAALFHNLAMGA